jgi:hypothetical protein
MSFKASGRPELAIRGHATQHPDHDRVGGALKGLRGPLHELREVIQKLRLYQVFISLLGAGDGVHENSQNDCCVPDSHAAITVVKKRLKLPPVKT